MKIQDKLKQNRKWIVTILLITILVSTSFYYIGRFSIRRRRTPVESLGESLGILTDFFFTYDIETYEQPIITRSSEELEYFSRTYIQNSSIDYTKEYLLGVTLFLLISGSLRAVEIAWRIGVKYVRY